MLPIATMINSLFWTLRAVFFISVCSKPATLKYGDLIYANRKSLSIPGVANPRLASRMRLFAQFHAALFHVLCFFYKEPRSVVMLSLATHKLLRNNYVLRELFHIIFIFLSRESDQRAIASSSRSCRPPVYHTKMGESH